MTYSYYNALTQLRKAFQSGLINHTDLMNAEHMVFWYSESDRFAED